MISTCRMREELSNCSSFMLLVGLLSIKTNVLSRPAMERVPSMSVMMYGVRRSTSVALPTLLITVLST